MERCSAEERALARRFGWIAHLRLALFASAVGLAVAGLWDLSSPSSWLLAGGGLALIGFMLAAGVHAGVEARRRRAAGLSAINRRALARLSRDYPALDAPRSWPGPDSATVRDLDLAGPASVWHLLGFARSPLGDARLAAWLCAPADPAEIAQRQEAVAELTPKLDLRQEMEWSAHALSEGAPDAAALLEWAEGEPWLLARPGLIWLARGLTALSLILLGLNLAGLMRPALWLVPVLVNLVVSGLCLGRLNRAFSQGDSAHGAFARYAELLAAVTREPYRSARLTRLAEAMGEGTHGARHWLRHLDRLLNLAELRRSTLASVFAQGLVLWDFHVLERLERWRLAVGGQVRGWLDALAELEALSALAGLAHAQPDWARPRIDPDQDGITAKALGHPLLPPAACVRNDVELGPASTCLLVTGSNMSGKSTLLRAVGVNLILAQAGSVVCAGDLAAPPCELGTSFRVTDKLSEGVSYFMAELTQLKAAVDQAGRVAAAGARAPVFLFDEILLGTNAEERRVAVERVLAHLLALGAFGVVATHDLSLADSKDLAGKLVPVHFSEQYEEKNGRPSMTFDYTLRPGLTPTTNALKLLAMVGLSDPDPAP